jgi:signal transduction histidine kinase/ActR/RegA family two-component response regulator
MPSLSLKWIWGRSLRWQLIGGVAVLHALLMTVFIAGLIGWQEHLQAASGAQRSPAAGQISLKHLVIAGLIYTLISAGVGTLFAWLLARSILKPLRLLQAGVARFAQDRLDQPIPITSANEVAEVSAAFNTAMDRLRKQQAQLREEISYRLRTQHEAEESSAAKDHFLALLSHELRTPLTPVLTLAQMLERDTSLDASTHQDITTIRRNVELEARLLDDLLDLTRIKRGKVVLHLQTVNIHEQLRAAVRLCQTEADNKRIDLVAELWADQASVSGDETRLAQVFWNLLSNAIKFTPAAGRVSIQTHLEPRASATQKPGPVENDLLIEFCDTGIGIEPGVLPHIFDAFEQGGREVTRAFGGLGLGLTISQGLVRLHGGELTARSEGHDRGATFAVRLPITAPATQRKGIKERNPSAIAGRQILLVEDHLDTSRATARLLSSCGYEVQTAQTVATAIQLTRSRHFDLIVSDIGLPDGTGHELIRQLVAEAPSHQMKGIAISGLGQKEDLRRSHEAGFMEHLVKPVDPGTLLHVVEEALADTKSDSSAPGNAF